MSVYFRFSASPLDRLLNIFTKQDVRLHIERKKVTKKSFFTTDVKKKLVSSSFTVASSFTTFKKTSSKLILKCKLFLETILQNIFKYNRRFRIFPLRKFILFNHVPWAFQMATARVARAFRVSMGRDDREQGLFPPLPNSKGISLVTRLYLVSLSIRALKRLYEFTDVGVSGQLTCWN